MAPPPEAAARTASAPLPAGAGARHLWKRLLTWLFPRHPEVDPDNDGSTGLSRQPG